MITFIVFLVCMSCALIVISSIFEVACRVRKDRALKLLLGKMATMQRSNEVRIAKCEHNIVTAAVASAYKATIEAASKPETQTKKK